jgi:hypothetical protein
VMTSTPGTELIRREGVFALEQTESIGRYHVVEVPLTPADRAVALAYARKVRTDLKPDATAMTRTLIGLHFATGLAVIWTSPLRRTYPLAHRETVAAYFLQLLPG